MVTRVFKHYITSSWYRQLALYIYMLRSLILEAISVVRQVNLCWLAKTISVDILFRMHACMIVIVVSTWGKNQSTCTKHCTYVHAFRYLVICMLHVQHSIGIHTHTHTHERTHAHMHTHMHRCTHACKHTHLGAVQKCSDGVPQQTGQETFGVGLSTAKEWEETILVDGELVRRKGRGNQLVHYTPHIDYK